MANRTHAFVLELIKRHVTNYNQSQLKIIDFGCGDGEFLNILDKKKLKKYYGYDINKESLEKLKARHNSNKVDTYLITDNDLDLGLKGSVDVIVAIGVFQYMTSLEIKSFLTEARRVLKKGGVVVFSCAHDGWFYRMFNLYSLFLPHSYFTKKEIISLFESHNFVVEFVTNKGLILNPLFSHNIVLFFDMVDILIFQNKGELGPVGKFARKLVSPILDFEFRFKTNLGYTIFGVARR
jgi:SAM-dependent methyltransferase